MSPDNQNCYYVPGSVFTRPSFLNALPFPLAGNPDLVSVQEITLPTGDNWTVFLDSTGTLQYNDPLNPGQVSVFLSQLTPGVQFKAANAFNKQFFAFYSPALAAAFSDNPFVGGDIPLYFDGQNIYRINSDGPGSAPLFSNLATSPVSVVRSAATGNLTITAALSTGEQQNVQYIPAIPANGPYLGQPAQTIITPYWTAITFTCSGTVPANWLGATVITSGLTGIYTYVNGTWVVTSVTGSTFTVAAYQTTAINLTSQSGTASVAGSYMVRSKNIVTCYTGSNSLGQIAPGFWVSVQNSTGANLNGPNWTISSISRDTNGLVKVTLSNQLTNLPVGAVLYINPSPLSYSGNVSVTNGGGLVTLVSGTSFDAGMVGSAISINGVAYTITAVGSASTLSISSPYQGPTSGNVAYTAYVAQFNAGYQTVYQVLPSATGTVFTYQSDDILQTTSTGGTVYQVWSPMAGVLGNAAQVITTGVDPVNGNYFTFSQLGPDANLVTVTGTPQAQIQAQVAQGPRWGSVFFTSSNGAQTAPAVPVQFNVVGGTSLLQVSQVPLGPPGTASRNLIFTPSEGSSYFYIAPTPLSPLGGVNQVQATGTIISDNTSTTALIDFSDTQLTSSEFGAVDVEGNDLFSQVVLAPCLGVIEYQTRLFWWGEINNIKNFVNMTFDGGYLPPNGIVKVTNNGTSVIWQSGTHFNTAWAGKTILLNNVPYTVNYVSSAFALALTAVYAGASSTAASYSVAGITGTQPLGWDPTQGDYAGTLSSSPVNEPYLGFSYLMQGGYNNLIQQTACTDIYGAPILTPETQYTFRCRAAATGTPTTGNLIVDFYSPTSGQVASATIPVSSLSSTLQWVVKNFSAVTPSSILNDTVLRVYLSDTTGGLSVEIDELEIIYTEQPVLNNQLRCSYADNPFGYSGDTGILGLDTTENVASAFNMRAYLYINTDQSLFQTVNNGDTEPNAWTITPYANACGSSGPNAVDTSEDSAMWAGRYGARLFTGTPNIAKLSQEIAPTWESINWANQIKIWVRNDPIQRITYWGIPTGASASVNEVLSLNYRMSDSVVNVMDPVHISPYSGKMISTDLGRKWSPWIVPMNAAALCTRVTPEGLSRVMVFAGSGYGELYVLDNPLAPTQYHDDNYGPIVSYYTTYFFYAHELEQSPLLQSYRKLFAYMGIHITGIGIVTITPYVDALTNAWPSKPPLTLSSSDPGFDLQMSLNVTGERCALKIAVAPTVGSLDAYFSLSHLLVSGRIDRVFPVRGSVI